MPNAHLQGGPCAGQAVNVPDGVNHINMPYLAEDDWAVEYWDDPVPVRTLYATYASILVGRDGQFVRRWYHEDLIRGLSQLQ
jgi:hypothetical protein